VNLFVSKRIIPVIN